MRIATMFAAAALATSALAAPAPEALPKKVKCRVGSNRPGCVKGPGGYVTPTPAPAPAPEQCMSDEDAQVVVDTFQSLIRGYTIEQALAALTEDFVDYSSAVSIVINKGAAVPNDITKPIFTSREQFMQGHGKQKPSMSF